MQAMRGGTLEGQAAEGRGEIGKQLDLRGSGVECTNALLLLAYGNAWKGKLKQRPRATA
jgi:hypothetical protein